jgi:DNA adenine methylase
VALSQLRLDFPVSDIDPPPDATLPRDVRHVYVPPIKCQGIKTKLVPFILSSVKWDGAGRWIEPFVGSGVVLFNLAPPRAYVADTNVHIIRFYRDIVCGALTPELVREHLQREGRRLAERGGEYYYDVRDRFNVNPSSLDFLFLNRSCFNGVIRFNRRGEFNVPFGKKPDRFRRFYVTKIVNQIAHVCRLLRGRDWTFEVASWRDTLNVVEAGDFVYADPPYFGRHTDYYDQWTEREEEELLMRLCALPAGFALSTWKENKYRRNPLFQSEPKGVTVRTTKHFYHVGPTEDLRAEMEEALIIRKGFAVP